MFVDDVYEVVRRIPRGRVMTYGAVACMAGRPGAARAVGWALHRNVDSEAVPCHRVVFVDGSLSSSYVFGGEEAQRKRLVAEGVAFIGDKVDSKLFWS